MRNTLMTLVACGALLAGVAPAQASSEREVSQDPVQALKSILASGHGVRFTETAIVSKGTKKLTERRREGTFEFNAPNGGVKALDVTTTGGAHGTERGIGFNHEPGGTSYQSGGLIGKWLKDGKVWWENSHQLYLWHTELLGYDEQLLNPTEPATVAALLKNGHRNGNSVTGVITFKQLGKARSVWFSHSTQGSWGLVGTKVSYTLTLTPTGSISRVQSRYTLAGGLDELVGRTFSVDTQYQGWGEKVSVKPPNSRDTTTELCINGEVCHWRLPS
ncbi:hypothetical protein AB0C33_03335 [Nonomuraea sp. NPDC048881]|uniref:hypothetical protein n=1 Tax=Nonomuraea sp. NPDC048881 TaxID=3155030 RepID=UPI0034103028